MEKTTKYLIIGFVVGMVVMFFISLALNGFKGDSKSTNNLSQTNEKALVDIFQSNFVEISWGYLNYQKDQENCRAEARRQLNPEQYPGVTYPTNDTMAISYKLSNLGEYRDDMWCKVYDNNKMNVTLLLEEYKLGNSDPEIISFPLDFRVQHDITVCCTVGGSKNPKSNEVCLPKIHVNTIPC